MTFVSLFVLMSTVIVGNFSQTVPCNSTQFPVYHCADNLTCLERMNFCNNVTNCPDGSDETPFDPKTSGEGIECQYRIPEGPVKCLLPPRYKCDHEIDCVGGWDECECNNTFTCDDPKAGCALKVSFCDGITDCSDNSDEKLFNKTTKVGFQCPVTKTHRTNNCVLPDRYVCDGISDCDYGIDECFCDFSSGNKKGRYITEAFSNDKCFRCLDSSLVIPNIFVSDGKIHCMDLSDECLCTKGTNRTKLDICASVCSEPDCPHGKVSCPSASNETISLDSTSICNHKHECANKLDEKYCAGADETFECYDEKFRIKKWQFCNGPSDCLDSSDEVFCLNLTDYFCEGYRKFSPNVTDWSHVKEEDNVNIPDGVVISFDDPYYARHCDGIPECKGLDDECFSNCSNQAKFCQFVEGYSKPFRCPVSGSVLIGVEICDGMPTCNETRPELSEDELYCPNRFYCKNRGSTRLPIHIPLSGHCNQIQECHDWSDEMNCSESTHYYCNDGGSVMFVSRNRVCDGNKDCRGGGDECHNCNPSPFSSDEKLINSRVLIVLLWIIALVAVVGNSLVFAQQIRHMIKPPAGTNKMSQCNRILVLNLSLADLLVGIYLLALGIKDASVHEYCQHDREWRSSFTCSSLGAMAVVGTEATIFILCIMTGYRFMAIVRPYTMQKLFVVKIAVIVSWLCSFVIALIPFAAKEYYMSCVWYRQNEFVGHICRPDLVVFMKNLVSLEGSTNNNFSRIINGRYTWKNMFNAMSVLNSSYVPERFFGYYSAHSVCLPRLFPDPDVDSSWGYSLFLILLNFFAFVYILASYIYIYKVSTQKTDATQASAEGRAASLQRKITRIILADFCCWMPICIMAFITLSGIKLSNEAYAVTAIILLPINAAVNPFLYTNIVDVIWELLLPARKWFRNTACGRQIGRLANTRSEGEGEEETTELSYSRTLRTTIARPTEKEG